MSTEEQKRINDQQVTSYPLDAHPSADSPESRLAGIIDSAIDAIITVNEDYKIQVFNRAAEKMFQCPAAEALGNSLDRFIPKRFRDSHSAHVQAFGKTDISSRTMAGARSVYGLRANGEEFPIEASISQVKADGRKLFTVIMRDVSERVRAEERFRQLVESMPNGIVMVDTDGLIALVNAQIERSFGYGRSELVGESIEILVPKRFRNRHHEFRTAFTAHPEARPMGSGRDLFGLRKDGTEFPIEIGLSPITTESGAMVLATIVDISERKRVEETLRQSQKQLAGIIGSAMDAIVSVDEDENIVLFNNTAEKMFLYPAEDALGQKLSRFIPERFRQTHHGHIKKFGQTNVTKRSMGSLGAVFGLRADGAEFPMEASISQLEIGGNKFYTVILRDISERKRAEETLQEQARILDLAPVLIIDLNSRITLWNSGAEQMYGWKAEEVLDKSPHAVLKTEFPRPLEEIKARLFSRGHWEGELVHTRRDGEQIVVASHWVLHKDQNHQPKAILEVNNDITETKRAQQEVLRLNEELERRVADRTAQLQAANKELEAFSYSVSHDLRAPLRHIDGFSQALLEDYGDSLDETASGFLKQIRVASQEMAQLIDDVLQLARVTRIELHREMVDLTATARDIVDKLRSSDSSREATVEITDGLVAACDKRLIAIVLTNLLGNAWKFTSKRQKTEISLTGCSRNGESVYSVRDNGAGFDMTFANKLFGTFQRLHSADQFEGTGVGLAIVQRIIHRHGGRVWAEGKPNEGATFYFSLPIWKEASHV